MRRYLLPFFMIFPLFVLSQTATENYVLTKTYKVETTSSISSPTLSQAYQEITYYDGLGRPKQHIAHKMGGNGQDLVTHIEYDALGRQTKDYLPYPRSSSSLNIDLNALSGTESYYNDPDFENTENPYSEKELELSPFNRVLKQAAPGETWALGNGHEIEFDRDANDAGEVYFFTVSNPGSTPTLVYEGNYDANELYKTVTKDENHSSGLDHTVEEFTDKQGRVVLKRGYNESVPHDTYYVYDDYGNLTFVLSPKLSKVIVNGGSLASGYQTMLANLGYQYKYDHRNRLVWKQLPGKTREYIAYNKQDQPVAVGPVLNPFPGGSGQGWTYTFYDTFGRVAYSVWYGTSVSESSRVNIENNLANFVATPTTSPTNIGGIQVYYTSVMSPTVEVLTATYYDDYRFSWAPSTFPSTVEGQAVGYNNQNLPKGLPTGSWTRILSGANDTDGLVSYTLYDAKARAIRSYSTNHIGGHDMVDTQYNFIGDVVKTLAHHQSSSENLDVEDTFSYTAQGRLDKHKQQFDGGTLVTLSENQYDALGQLESKEVGDGLQTVDYKYNVRGWLTDINDIGTLGNDLFAFKISYEGLSNGNISRTQWKTAMDNRTRRYNYSYDALNRLLDAYYSSDLGTSSYNESLNYDENGNITGLVRNGLFESHVLAVVMDNLSYTYDTNSNQLLSVYDITGNPGGFDDGNTSGDDYDYDVYGNMVEDANKYIANISYNHLNLPKQITIAGPSVAEQGTIDYLYAANGTKLRKKVDAVSGMQIDYVGSFYYEDSSLKFVNHAEGYLEEGRSGWQYVYQYKDHLGNIRLSYSDLDGNGSIDTGSEILEENNYYPFGLRHKGYNNIQSTEFNYKTYQGQELDKELDLNWHQFRYRAYDAAIGRFLQIDPLAPTYVYNSTYAFAENNVTSGIDLEGKELSFEMDGNLATGVKREAIPVTGTYTLQQVRQMQNQRMSEEQAARNILTPLPNQNNWGSIEYSSTHISKAKYLYPQSGLMMAEGVGIGSKEAVADIALGGVFYYLGKGFQSVWKIDKFVRGRMIEDMLGANKSWARNFPTIDKIENGIATSIKSVDLEAKTYQKGNNLFNTLKGYINKLDDFTSQSWAGVDVVQGESYTSKALELAVQTGKGTDSQWDQIGQAIQYALDKDINVSIRFID